MWIFWTLHWNDPNLLMKCLSGIPIGMPHLFITPQRSLQCPE